jgi:hypothetical protein
MSKSERNQFVTVDWWVPPDGNADRDRMFGAKSEPGEKLSAAEWLARCQADRGQDVDQLILVHDAVLTMPRAARSRCRRLQD